MTVPKGPPGVEECEDNDCAGCPWCDAEPPLGPGNRVTCSDCAETMAVDLLAEELEGKRMNCVHCGGVGVVVVHENDEGGLASIELVIPD